MPSSLYAFAGLCALSILAGCTITSPASAAGYKDKALEASDFIQANLYDPSAGLYRPSVPRDPKGLPYDFMWGNGVQFTSLVSAAKYEPEKYGPVLKAFTEGLKRYWDKDAPIPGFDAYHSSPDHDDKYYDDNAWLVLGFVEAYELTKDPAYLDWARATQTFVLSGWDEKLGGGIYWYQDKKSKNTCSNAPTSAAAARLYLVGGDKDQFEWAKRIREWTIKNLQDTDGLFFDNVKLDGTVEKTKWTYNTALMIRTDVLLAKATGEMKYLDSARRMADAGLNRWADPKTGAFADSAKFNHLFSESLLNLYEATKDVKYLNAVRKHASFGYRHVRDPEGGYRNQWRRETRRPNERKQTIENASVARLFWLLAPYQTPEELYKKGQTALKKNQLQAAEELFRQAVESDAEAVESRVALWKSLRKAGKSSQARIQADHLAVMAEDPANRKRMTAAGWSGEPESGG